MGIDVLKFLYKNEAFVDVEIWDSAGQERFNENYLYSQSYVQSRSGVILLIEATEDTNAICEKIKLLKNNMNDNKQSLCVFITKSDQLYGLKALK